MTDRTMNREIVKWSVMAAIVMFGGRFWLWTFPVPLLLLAAVAFAARRMPQP